MSGTISVDGQRREFKADEVYVDLQPEQFTFFGAKTNSQAPREKASVEVHLQPQAIVSGTYKVGSSELAMLIYVDPDSHKANLAIEGEVSFNRSDSLKRIFGSIDGQFEINSKRVSINLQYDIREWGKK